MKRQGYRYSTKIEESDIAIFNTCHIREKASEKLFQTLEELRYSKKIK